MSSDAEMFDIESARELLSKADVFYYNDPSELEDDESDLFQTLNMNDTWGWATAHGEYVPDDELPRVAELFWRYGWCGVLFWVSKRNDNMQSEFHDINRFVEFVQQEEAIRTEIRDSSKRAYTKREYNIGG